MYVKPSAVRISIKSAVPLGYLSDNAFVNASADIDLFSGDADVHIKFMSPTTLVIRTTRFTRIRLPVVINDAYASYTERLVLMTSHDRSLVAALSSRVVQESNILTDVEHNTPLVVMLPGACADLTVEVNSGGQFHNYTIKATRDGKKYEVPDDLNVTSKHFKPMPFDAKFPARKRR